MATKSSELAEQVKRLKESIHYHLRYGMAVDSDNSATRVQHFNALSEGVRDLLMDKWLATRDLHNQKNVREIYYFSLEFLIGRLLANNVLNLGMEKVCQEALKGQPYDWDALKDFEPDAGLGNGGLGRLAACYMDSLATLELPAVGYGLRYDFGIFRQNIQNGSQVEEPDNWLAHGYPWEMKRPEREVTVCFGGNVRVVHINGRDEWQWIPAQTVKGIPYDIPVVGKNGKCINTLRLWSAVADNEFDLGDFNRGSYVDAVQHKVMAENLTKVLYPNDNVDQGKELRLRQQYFFVACSLRDIFRRHLSRGNRWEDLPQKVFIQLNDTHPTLVIPEMMRILVDEERMDWEKAWDITTHCVGYTNHTVLPEALETWRFHRFAQLLPRHMQIVLEINGRFLQEVSNRCPGDIERLTRMSIIQETPFRAVRMANLAIIGSCKVNGVAKLHSQILRDKLFRDFSEFWPEKFDNVTNGITQRRWLELANPRLSALITDAIGPRWVTDLSQLQKLADFTNDRAFLKEFHEIKQENKKDLAKIIYRELHIEVDPESLFDIQVKRIHEYKRQLLLALYIIYLYNRIIENPELDIAPRTFLFAGKSAPGYATAKLIIRLIHCVGTAVNNHPVVSKKLRVVFLPDYRVSLAEKIIPAANLSEQISLAGMEASGTGNMKLMLNGAITIGTLDGANVEIHEEVGDDNIFLFGLKADEVVCLRPTYNPRRIYEKDADLRKVLDTIAGNVFSILTPGIFEPLVKNLLDYGDYYMLLADFRSYVEAQERADALYRNPREWDKRALLNVAYAGKFSSDRAIQEYAERIWHLDKP